jgi:CRP-like cAMP-binding protein
MKIDAPLLAAQPFLKGLSKSQLEVLANNAMLVEFLPGRLIFEEGLEAHRFYLILEGTIALESSNANGGSDLVQTIKAGDVLGWSWLFPPYLWNFDARAVEPTKAIIFFAPTLRELCESDHHLGYEMLKRVAQVVISRLQSSRVQALKRAKKNVKAAATPPKD